jgi:hypothetical protein
MTEWRVSKSFTMRTPRTERVLEAAHTFLAPHLDHLLAILDREQNVEAIGAETLEKLAFDHPITRSAKETTDVRHLSQH